MQANPSTVCFGAIRQPLADARGSDQSHDREGVVSARWSHNFGDGGAGTGYPSVDCDKLIFPFMPTMDTQSLKSMFQGELLEPADAGYNEARRIWNASVNKRPALIARCTGVADVVAAVNFGRTNNLLTAVRGGGHNVGGRALCDDGLVIDLSRMRAVYADPANRTVRVQGGATLGDVDRETH